MSMLKAEKPCQIFAVLSLCVHCILTKLPLSNLCNTEVSLNFSEMFTLPGMVVHAFKSSIQTETWSQNGGRGRVGEGEEGRKKGREGGRKIFTFRSKLGIY